MLDFQLAVNKLSTDKENIKMTHSEQYISEADCWIQWSALYLFLFKKKTFSLHDPLKTHYCDATASLCVVTTLCPAALSSPEHLLMVKSTH